MMQNIQNGLTSDCVTFLWTRPHGDFGSRFRPTDLTAVGGAYYTTTTHEPTRGRITIITIVCHGRVF